MPAAVGELRRRMRFEYRKPAADDGYGNREEEWTCGTEQWARVLPLRGSETVIAARLQGVQPVIITVRVSSQTREITPAWRAVDKGNGTIYNIRSGANYDEHNQRIDFMAEAGVPI